MVGACPRIVSTAPARALLAAPVPFMASSSDPACGLTPSLLRFVVVMIRDKYACSAKRDRYLLQQVQPLLHADLHPRIDVRVAGLLARVLHEDREGRAPVRL